MKRKIWFIALSAFWVAGNCSRANPARIFYVAPAPLGDDTHDGGAGAPFATLDRARRAVRPLIADPAHGEIVVELRAGLYELAAPVRFEAVDSGTKDAPVIYRAAPGETPILSGGRRIDGWTRESADTYQAKVGTSIDFRQLWVDDRRAVRARTPNVGRTFQLSEEKQANGFDLPHALLADLKNLRAGEVEMAIQIAWMHKRLRIASLAETTSSRFTRAVIEATEWNAVTKQPQGDRVYLGRAFWLENAREFLDAPGEFFLDRKEGILRYRPRPGEELTTATIIRPELETLLLLEGRPDAPVHDLHFEGLTFAHTGWTRPNRSGFVDIQANSLVPADPTAWADPQYRHNLRKDRIPAAFQATTADNIVIQTCRFVRLGGTGVSFTHGGNDNVIEGNTFFDLAAGGVELGEDAVHPTDPRFFPRRNRIANNFFAHLGEDYFGSVPILGYYTDHSLITHNEIAAIPYTAISQGWGWGQPLSPPDSRANRITHNRISNYMRRLDDGGGIYTTDPQAGSEIAFNVVQRMTPPDTHSKAGGALYLDQFTSGYHVHHNVVTEALRWLNIWNPNIRHNRVDQNFSDTTTQRNDGTDNRVEPVNLLTGHPWPATAIEIEKSAGLEPAFASARNLPTPHDLIVESTSVDFQTLTGTWNVAHNNGNGASRLESTDPNASARWMPILPETADYEVSVWRMAGSAPATYTVRCAAEKTMVAVAATETGWTRLGVFHHHAGFGDEVEITAATPSTGKPLIADALRWRKVH